MKPVKYLYYIPKVEFAYFPEKSALTDLTGPPVELIIQFAQKFSQCFPHCYIEFEFNFSDDVKNLP